MTDEILKVVDPTISIYGDEEIGAAANRIPSALKGQLPDNVNAQEFIVDFETERERFKKAGGSITANPETKNRRSVDKVRERSFLFFRSRTESFIHSEDNNIVESAILLMGAIKRRGYSLHTEGLDKETVLMDGLIADLQIPEMQKAMEVLGVKAEFDDMVKCENAYKQVDEARMLAATKKESIPMIEARKGMCLVISECNDWLRRRYRKEPLVMEPMVRHWNEIITELNAQAQSLETRKANEAAAEKKPAPTV